MKNLLYYKITIAVLAVVAGSLGYYFIENQSKIKDYECKSGEINETLNIQYEKGVKKMRFISIIEKEGAKETILGYEYDAYEKSGEVLFENYQKPIGGDMFLGLKDMGTSKNQESH